MSECALLSRPAGKQSSTWIREARNHQRGSTQLSIRKAPKVSQGSHESVWPRSRPACETRATPGNQSAHTWGCARVKFLAGQFQAAPIACVCEKWRHHFLVAICYFFTTTRNISRGLAVCSYAVRSTSVLTNNSLINNLR